MNAKVLPVPKIQNRNIIGWQYLQKHGRKEALQWHRQYNGITVLDIQRCVQNSQNPDSATQKIGKGNGMPIDHSNSSSMATPLVQ